MSAPSVSVLIVNFNSGPWLARAVASLHGEAQVCEVLVGDNGSSDDSLARLQAVLDPQAAIPCRVLPFGQNLGFATAVNRLLQAASGECLLLLNPDCQLLPGALDTCLAALAADPQAGMAGCLIRNPDGSEQRGCRRRMPTLTSSLARSLPGASWLLQRLGGAAAQAADFDLTLSPLPAAVTPVEAISGAFMLVRRSAVARVGAMDEGYFLHCEDLDWCLRFTQAGYRIVFVPQAAIIHAQGACSAARPVRVEWHKHWGMWRFFRKFHGADPPWLLGLVGVGIAGRFGLTLLRTLLQRLRQAAKAPAPGKSCG